MKGNARPLVKFCGLTRTQDILAANGLNPDLIGFVFAPKSRRFITAGQAEKLKALLDPGIRAAGVFVDAPPEEVAALLKERVIDLVQLHGAENDAYIRELRRQTGWKRTAAVHEARIIKAFQITDESSLAEAEQSSADMVLLDSGAGCGKTFDWECLKKMKRPYFLAGGLNAQNAEEAVRRLHPFGVDVSSGIETDGRKDGRKMEAFMEAVRRAGI